jgi:hypothetical protein
MWDNLTWAKVGQKFGAGIARELDLGRAAAYESYGRCPFHLVPSPAGLSRQQAPLGLFVLTCVSRALALGITAGSSEASEGNF